MKITVRNLGVLDQADIDLKPLTVLVGPNNAGKTWLAYTIASVLGPYGWGQYTSAYLSGKVQDSYLLLDEAIDRVLEGGDAHVNLLQFLDQYGETYVNNVAAFAKVWMRDYLRTALVNFENLEVHIRLEEAKEEARKAILQYSLDRKFGVGRGKRSPLLNVLKEAGKPDLYIYTSAEGNKVQQSPRRAIKEFLATNTFEVFRRALFSDKPIFPTERTTYITYPFDIEEAEPEEVLTDARPLNQRRVRILSGPISTFLSMIHTTYQMSLLEKKEREEEGSHDKTIGAYIHFSRVLEDIIGGDILFSNPEPGTLREIIFQAKNSVALEIPIASSMVKELSSLVLYLRYLSEPGDWLIIDEPEMNLHPEAQAKIIEFLAILANSGLRVLFTTHSPYMLDHLENLMKAAEYVEEDQKAIAQEFFLQRPDAFISQEHVSVYLVDNKKTENILEDGKINWGTFGDVTDRVAKIHYQL